MSRKRWVQDPVTLELVPAEEYVPKNQLIPHGRVHGDLHYDGLRATDGTDISTRTKHREYMRRHGLATVDDYKKTWSEAEKRRTEYRTRGVGGAATGEVGRIVHQLEEASRRRH